MTAPKSSTLVTFLLDRTQSMGIIRQPTIDAFNAYLASLKEEKGDGFVCDFTLLQFDSISLDRNYVAVPVKDVKPLDFSTFVPRGSTPLIDSCVKTIRAVEESLNARDDKPKVVICFQTDGEENSSRQHTWAELNDLIKEKTLAGWEFNFMGAGIDAYQQASKMGIATLNTVSYDSSSIQATCSGFQASASNARGFGTGALRNTGYSVQQKMESGDRFDPAQKVGNIDLTKKSALVGKSIVDDFSLNAKN